MLAGDAWAIVNIIQSKTPDRQKILWTLVILLLPLLGLILWIFLGFHNDKN